MHKTETDTSAQARVKNLSEEKHAKFRNKSIAQQVISCTSIVSNLKGIIAGLMFFRQCGVHLRRNTKSILQFDITSPIIPCT